MTEVPTGPEDGDKLVMYGVTAKGAPLLGTPFTVTTTLPVLVPLGTGTVIELSLQPEGMALVPLNVTVLVA